jgi:hypothetical protein
MTAPSGARLPRSTAKVSDATSAVSIRRMTSSLHTRAPAMFSPSVRPFAVSVLVSSRSRRLFKSARNPPA